MLGQYAYKSSVCNIPKCSMTKKARESMGLRQCPDLGLWVTDRGAQTCVWKTKACKDCYVHKSLIYKHTKKAWSPGGKDDQQWSKLTPDSFKGLNRVRLCTRGEAFPDLESIQLVSTWIEKNPNVLFWIPTRSWKKEDNSGIITLNYDYIRAMQFYLQPLDNSRVMWSMDEYTEHLWDTANYLGFSTLYYQRHNKPAKYFSKSNNVRKCRKTWTKLINPKTGRPCHPKSVCKTCRSGCYEKDRVDVWLMYHK